MALLLRLAVVAGAVWLSVRLWPAIKSEPSTWLGEDWTQKVKRPLTT